MANDVDRAIASLRTLAAEIEEGDAHLREIEIEQVWDNNPEIGDRKLEGKNIDIWVEYD